ncbi:unnamed protein product [Symbiodinium sp. CCMP2592]|nr:unnamed protein product [Symbiodinium sp. CCMP2592]
MALRPADVGELFRTDAACNDTSVVLGGWFLHKGPDPKKAPWFQIILGRDEVPWLFKKDSGSSWASTSAEVLASLAALHLLRRHFKDLWSVPGHFRASFCGGTDNKSAEALSCKLLTTRVPLMFVVMEFVTFCDALGFRCNLSWRPRDSNQEADRITKHVFEDFDENLLKDTVLPAGSIDAFLSNQMEKKLDFARWMGNFCPADAEKAYSIDSNGCYLRPFQLGWRSDFGISGMMEPETAELLLELILTEGFLTDPNVVGVEKLGVTLPPPEYLDGGITECPAINLGSALLPPFSVGYVKGWKRAVCLILALCGIRVLGLEAEVPHHIRVTMGTIHCSFGAFQDVKAKVLASRGGAEQQFSETQNEIDWHSQTAIAKAFQIGRSEAGAVQQLITAVPKDVKNALETAVKQRGMVKFLGHEAVARQLFSASYINTSPGMDAWRDQLTNAPGDSRIASLLVERLVSDFDLAPEPLRKAPTCKETVTKHACCAAMLHFLGLLEAMCPGKEFPELRRQLMHQFHHGYLDTDLVHVLESAVPPADLKSVSAFRAVVVQIETQAQAEMDATQAEHARQVREATLAQITALVESDIKALRQRTPDHVLKAIAAAKDLKYVKDRQMQGDNFVHTWMAEYCHCEMLDETLSCKGNNVLPNVLKYLGQFRGIAGTQPLDDYLSCSLESGLK